MPNLFRVLPSVDGCLGTLESVAPAFFATTPRPLLRDLVNRFLDERREDIREGRLQEPEQLELSALSEALVRFVKQGARPRFRRLLNATGVIIHTNMGRSVLPEEAIEAVVNACRGYSNLELDLETGERGSRYSHVEALLCQLTGAEAALVVNNNAAAVLITLDALCSGGEVVVSRGQLVEIGGSFRIPDVMTRSGATLHEVGCTNRVHLKDYAQAINERTSALMRVHTSNYRIVGFHSDVPVDELATLAHQYALPLIEDLGSGSFLDFSAHGLPGEPTVRSVVAAGADIVTFSGDKVLGGPQSGIIVGKKERIERIKANPLNRALRIDKMTIAALEATLRLYLDATLARSRIPTVSMMTTPPDVLRRRATRLAARLKKACGEALLVRLVAGASRVGGGSFPENDLPTTLVRLETQICTPEVLRTRLLHAELPLLGRLENDAFHLDPRTLTDAELAEVATSVASVLTAT
ncbi:MAG: L-seryl-tRNA(Sec) selenium transferase, partial [Bilophila sp.]